MELRFGFGIEAIEDLTEASEVEQQCLPSFSLG